MYIHVYGRRLVFVAYRSGMQGQGPCHRGRHEERDVAERANPGNLRRDQLVHLSYEGNFEGLN